MSGLPPRSRANWSCKCASTFLYNWLLPSVLLWEHMIPNHWFSLSWVLWPKAERTRAESAWLARGELGRDNYWVHILDLPGIKPHTSRGKVSCHTMRTGMGARFPYRFNNKLLLFHLGSNSVWNSRWGWEVTACFSGKWGHRILIWSVELII